MRLLDENILHCKYSVIPSTKATNLQNSHDRYGYGNGFGHCREKTDKPTKHKILEMSVNQHRVPRANQDAQ